MNLILQFDLIIMKKRTKRVQVQVYAIFSFLNCLFSEFRVFKRILKRKIIYCMKL